MEIEAAIDCTIVAASQKITQGILAVHKAPCQSEKN
jgi:hypothetical protein